jgi:trehalose 6-phosphate phosphatase
MVKAELDEIDEVWRNSPVYELSPSELMLVTDFDGTLADIVPDPVQSAALPESLTAVRRLTQKLKQVVVLSSRTSVELAELVPVSGVRLIADSGLTPPDAHERRALERFNAEAAKLLGNLPGAWLELKPASTTVHFRNSTASGEEVLALLRPLVKDTGLYGALGRKVIEVHSRFAGKGTALTAQLTEIEPGGVVCMGDDENDRSAFEVVSRLDIPHMCVGVASDEAPKDLFDRCELIVAGPSEAARFLQLLADWASA